MAFTRAYDTAKIFDFVLSPLETVPIIQSMDIEHFKRTYIENTKKWAAQREAEAKRLASLPPYVPTDCKRDGHAWNVYERFGHTETLECAVCRELKQVYVD